MKLQLTQFVTKKRLSEAVKLSPSSFKRYRLSGIWPEGLYWIRINPKLVLYNLPLILDWIANIDDKQAHLRAIENYQASLLSGQPRKPGRKPKTPASVAYRG